MISRNFRVLRKGNSVPERPDNGRALVARLAPRPRRSECAGARVRKLDGGIAPMAPGSEGGQRLAKRLFQLLKVIDMRDDLSQDRGEVRPNMLRHRPRDHE